MYLLTYETSIVQLRLALDFNWDPSLRSPIASSSLMLDMKILAHVRGSVRARPVLTCFQ
jgi:hypothetical protein